MRNLKIFTISLAVFWFILIGTILFATIPTPYNLNLETRNYAQNLVPEGWGFFTRNPREEMPDIYSYNERKQLISHIEPCSSPKFFFGLARECRMNGAELGELIKQIDDSLWIEGNNISSALSFDNNVKTVEVNNNFKDAVYFGEYFLVKKERIPWAWSKNYRKLAPRFKYVKVLVKAD